MGKRIKSDAELRAELAVQKARERLQQIRRKDTKAKRKEHATAIFTVGAMFADLLTRDPKTADEVMRDLIEGVNTDLLYDARRQAVLNSFGYELPEKTQATTE